MHSLELSVSHVPQATITILTNRYTFKIRESATCWLVFTIGPLYSSFDGRYYTVPKPRSVFTETVDQCLSVEKTAVAAVDTPGVEPSTLPGKKRGQRRTQAVHVVPRKKDNREELDKAWGERRQTLTRLVHVVHC